MSARSMRDESDFAPLEEMKAADLRWQQAHIRNLQRKQAHERQATEADRTFPLTTTLAIATV